MLVVNQDAVVLGTTWMLLKTRHAICCNPPWTNTTGILRKTSLTAPGSLHPARCGAGFCSSPSKPSCIFRSRCAPAASLKSSRRSCRALWFPPSKPYLLPFNLKPLCTSSQASREPGTPPQLADSHCKEKSLLLTVSFPFLGKRIWSSQWHRVAVRDTGGAVPRSYADGPAHCPGSWCPGTGRGRQSVFFPRNHNIHFEPRPSENQRSQMASLEGACLPSVRESSPNKL